MEFPKSLELKDEKYISCITIIREYMKVFWEKPFFRHYTEHGVKHSEKILKIIGELLKDYNNILSEKERFILIAAIYLHDIGMQSPTYAGLEKKSIDNYSTKELEQVRSKHHETSEKIILDSIEKESEIKLGLDLHKDFVDIIATVAKYHRKLDLKNLKNYQLGIDEIKLPLLAALLRLGDELDADYERVNLETLKIFDIPLESKYQWWKHTYVQGIKIENGQIRLYFKFSQKYKESNKDIVEDIKKEVKLCIESRFDEVYDILFGADIKLYKEVIFEDETYSSTKIEMPYDLEEYVKKKYQTEINVLQ